MVFMELSKIDPLNQDLIQKNLDRSTGEFMRSDRYYALERSSAQLHSVTMTVQGLCLRALLEHISTGLQLPQVKK